MTEGSSIWFQIPKITKIVFIIDFTCWMIGLDWCSDEEPSYILISFLCFSILFRKDY